MQHNEIVKMNISTEPTGYNYYRPSDDSITISGNAMKAGKPVIHSVISHEDTHRQQNMVPITYSPKKLAATFTYGYGTKIGYVLSPYEINAAFNQELYRIDKKEELMKKGTSEEDANKEYPSTFSGPTPSPTAVAMMLIYGHLIGKNNLNQFPISKKFTATNVETKDINNFFNSIRKDSAQQVSYNKYVEIKDSPQKIHDYFTNLE
jgi:hypothetical protein